MASPSAIYMCALCDEMSPSKETYKEHMAKAHQTPDNMPEMSTHSPSRNSQVKDESTPMTVTQETPPARPGNAPDRTHQPEAGSNSEEAPGPMHVDESLLCHKESRTTMSEPNSEPDPSKEGDLTSEQASVTTTIEPDQPVVAVELTTDSIPSQSPSQENKTTEASYPGNVGNRAGLPAGHTFGLPVECGPNKALLCGDSANQTRLTWKAKCVFFEGKWLTVRDLMELSGKSRWGVWEEGILHNNKTLKWLLDNDILTTSPPACRCNFCKKNKSSGDITNEPMETDPSPSSAENSYISLSGSESEGQDHMETANSGLPLATSRDAMEVQKDPMEENQVSVAPCSKDTTMADYESKGAGVNNERPAGLDYALPVKCGSNEAWLCLVRLAQMWHTQTGQCGECIFLKGEWYTPSQFMEASCPGDKRDWDEGIYHFSETIKWLLDNDVITISPPACHCSSCMHYRKQMDSPACVYVCHLCDETFYKKIPFMRHLRTAHWSPSPTTVRTPDRVQERDQSQGSDSSLPDAASPEQLTAPASQVLVVSSTVPSSQDTDTSSLDAKDAADSEEKPTDAEYLVPIQCGSTKAWMCLGRLRDSIDSVFFDGDWLQPSVFSRMFLQRIYNWQMGIKHHGSSIMSLLRMKTMTIDPPSCKCQDCKTESGLDTDTERRDVTKEPVVTVSTVTRSPEDSKQEVRLSDSDSSNATDPSRGSASAALAIPVECCSNKAWLCVGLISNIKFQKGVPNILFKKDWYTPVEFKNLSGLKNVRCWKSVIKHHCTTMKHLLATAKITISPPACNCFVCTDKESPGIQVYLCTECGENFKSELKCKEHIEATQDSCKSSETEPTAEQKSHVTRKRASDSFTSTRKRMRSGDSGNSKESSAYSHDDASDSASTNAAEELLSGPELVLPIECGPNKAWLCVGRLGKHTMSNTPCVLFNKEMVLPLHFIQLSGIDDVKSWKSVTKHHGASMNVLLERGIITSSPPACHCDTCTDTESSCSQMYLCGECHKIFNTKDLCEEHTQSSHSPSKDPDDDVSVLVECGQKKARLYVGEISLNPGERNSEAILFNGRWVTPFRFVRLCGKTSGEWKRAIRHNGHSVRWLLKNGVITVSPPACHCEFCRTERTSDIQKVRQSAKSGRRQARDDLDSSPAPVSKSPAAKPVSKTPIKTPQKESVRTTRRNFVSSSTNGAPSSSVRNYPVISNILGSKTIPEIEVPAKPLTVNDLTSEEIINALKERKAFFKCVCGILFRDQTMFHLHQGMHSSNDPYECSFCGHKAPDWYDFNSHYFAHSK